jgi:hypothetical protein
MKTIILAAALGLALTSGAFAQKPVTVGDEELSSPLAPGVTFYRFRLGATLGAGPAFQSGELKTDVCDCPAFTDGAGHTLAAGLVGEYYATANLDFGLLLALDYKTINALYREYEAVPLKQTATGEIINQRVQFRHTTDASVTALAVHPFVKFHPYKGIFVRTGPSFNFAMSSSLRHEKELLDRTARLPNGEEVELSLNLSDPRVFSATKALIQDTELPGIKSPAMLWNIAAGIDIRAGRKMVITPLFQYSLPMSDISSSGSAFRMSGWLIMAEVKVRIK